MYLGILGLDPLLVKPMVPELALTRVCTMRTATIDTVSLVRALCDICVSWRNRWDGVGIALAAASDPAMFIGHMRAHAVRTGHARGPAKASAGGGPMETSLTDGWGVGVLALLLMGEP